MRLLDDRRDLEVISRTECFSLLRSCHIGRLAVVSRDEPQIFPVNYALDGEDVVFRTAPGTKFDAAVRTTRVAFEIDSSDGTDHSGWSVVVRGRADEVLHATERQRLAQIPLRPWAGGEQDNWIRIHAESVTGRRVGPLTQR